MNEAAILEKLDRLSEEIREMKADILEEVREEIRAEQAALVSQEPAEGSAVSDAVQLQQACGDLVSSLEDLRDMSTLFRAGSELREDFEPVIQQAYPGAIRFFQQLEGEFQVDELILTLRKMLTNMDTFSEGIDLLRAGVEFRDEMVPIIQLAYPKLLRALTALHEGEFRAERMGDLLHTVLMNVQTLSDLLNMIQPFTELVKEVTVLMQQTSILPDLNKWLNGLQTGSPLLRLATTAATAAKNLELDEAKIARICDVIKDVDIKKVEPLGPVAMVKGLRDPQVQEALGFFFMLMQTVGSCLQAWDGEKSTITGQQR